MRNDQLDNASLRDMCEDAYAYNSLPLCAAKVLRAIQTHLQAIFIAHIAHNCRRIRNQIDESDVAPHEIWAFMFTMPSCTDAMPWP